MMHCAVRNSFVTSLFIFGNALELHVNNPALPPKLDLTSAKHAQGIVLPEFVGRSNAAKEETALLETHRGNDDGANLQSGTSDGVSQISNPRGDENFKVVFQAKPIGMQVQQSADMCYIFSALTILMPFIFNGQRMDSYRLFQSVYTVLVHKLTSEFGDATGKTQDVVRYLLREVGLDDALEVTQMSARRYVYHTSLISSNIIPQLHFKVLMDATLESSDVDQLLSQNENAHHGRYEIVLTEQGAQVLNVINRNSGSEISSVPDCLEGDRVEMVNVKLENIVAENVLDVLSRNFGDLHFVVFSQNEERDFQQRVDDLIFNRIREVVAMSAAVKMDGISETGYHGMGVDQVLIPVDEKHEQKWKNISKSF